MKDFVNPNWIILISYSIIYGSDKRYIFIGSVLIFKFYMAQVIGYQKFMSLDFYISNGSV